MRVLILNSDSPKNRGDRAILAGNIELVRASFPNAKIFSLSQFPQRDAEWFGIEFLPFSPYSVSPVDYLKLLGAARKADLVLWGGGEILKDYTNKLSLFYWALKLTGVRLMNRNLVGAFQGIGPTRAGISKRVIAYTVGRCRAFLVRDGESQQKLSDWGVRIPVVASFDPAVFDVAKPATDALVARFAKEQNVPVEFMKNFAGFGLRRWFHYSQSGWLPASMRFWDRRQPDNSPALETYLDRLAALADAVIAEQDVNLVFFPMHVSASENDPEFARQVVARMKHGERTTVINGDEISPADYLSLIGAARFFVASRLHSAILATVAGVPAICLYYVDKGRLFFEQIGLQRFSRDIAIMQQPGAVDELSNLVDELVSDADSVRDTQRSALARMRGQIQRDFAGVVGGSGNPSA